MFRGVLKSKMSHKSMNYYVKFNVKRSSVIEFSIYCCLWKVFSMFCRGVL